MLLNFKFALMKVLNKKTCIGEDIFSMLLSGQNALVKFTYHESLFYFFALAYKN